MTLPDALEVDRARRDSPTRVFHGDGAALPLGTLDGTVSRAARPHRWRSQ